MKSIQIICCLLLLFTACEGRIDLMESEEQDSIEVMWINKDTLTVAHWNIGHMAQGRSNDTTIPKENADSMAIVYHSLLDTLNTDIIGICEYNSSFSKKKDSTRETLFGDYPYFVSGEKFSYNYNIIFSHIPLYDNHSFCFKHRTQQRYYLETTLRINGHIIRFVETHLDWDEGSTGQTNRASQIKELIESYLEEPFVIICADFNTSTISEFDTFSEYGYSIANDGRFLTYPSTKPAKAIDNIIFKGVELLSADVITAPNLSDHSLLRCRLIIPNEKVALPFYNN